MEFLMALRDRLIIEIFIINCKVLVKTKLCDIKTSRKLGFGYIFDLNHLESENDKR
jgi:hypothetical protein